MAYYDDKYWSLTDPRTWTGKGGWRTGSPTDAANRDADRGIDPLNKRLLGAINPVPMVTTAMDRAGGSRALRGLVAGRPRELLSVIPGSDTFGLTSPRDEKASHFGLVGDMALSPGSIGSAGKLGFRAGKAALGAVRPRPTPAPAATLAPAPARQLGDFGAFGNRRPAIPPARPAPDPAKATAPAPPPPPLPPLYPPPDPGRGIATGIVADEVKRALPGLPGKATADHLRWKVGATAEKMASEPAGPFPEKLDLMRRGSRMYKEKIAGPGQIDYRGVGGGAVTRNPSHRARAVDQADRAWAEVPGLRGFAQPGASYTPGHAVVYAPRPGDAAARFGETVRHERVHALMQEAARRGDAAVETLPALFRVPTQLQRSSLPMNRALGMLADETVAQSLGKRGLGNQMRQGMGFLFDPMHPGRDVYAQDASDISRVVGGAYRALPAAWDAGRTVAGGAAIGAGAATLNAIRNGRYDPNEGEF